MLSYIKIWIKIFILLIKKIYMAKYLITNKRLKNINLNEIFYSTDWEWKICNIVFCMLLSDWKICNVVFCMLLSNSKS
jgi:hypothetical protein